jgi:hypothetical protein
MWQELQVAQLRFDSCREPISVGTRSSDAPNRYLLYKARDLVVDVRLETDRRSNSVNIVGQVMGWNQSQEDVDSNQVVLLRKKDDVLDRTVAGLFGEFQFTVARFEKLYLAIETQDQRPIVISLPEDLAESRSVTA